jgi:hypothetical protein
MKLYLCYDRERTTDVLITSQSFGNDSMPTNKMIIIHKTSITTILALVERKFLRVSKYI